MAHPGRGPLPRRMPQALPCPAAGLWLTALLGRVSRPRPPGGLSHTGPLWHMSPWRLGRSTQSQGPSESLGVRASQGQAECRLWGGGAGLGVAMGQGLAGGDGGAGGARATPLLLPCSSFLVGQAGRAGAQQTWQPSFYLMLFIRFQNEWRKKETESEPFRGRGGETSACPPGLELPRTAGSEPAPS